MLKKLYWIVENGRNGVEGRLKESLFGGVGPSNWKRWICAHPKELLCAPLADVLNVLKFICDRDFPIFQSTPHYGDDWGMSATYIELIPRVLGTFHAHGLSSSEGILGCMRMLPLFPVGEDGSPTCVVLSQLFSTMRGDGHLEGENSLYAITLNGGISADLVSPWLEREGQRLTPEDQVIAFNDLAHFRGLKTGFRMGMCSGQIYGHRGGEGFSWENDSDVEQFINQCVYGIRLGFDCIFFDSARHVGDFEMHTWRGVGLPPPYHVMQKITHEIRCRSGRQDLSFVGERCSGDPWRYHNMGLTCGSYGALDMGGVRYEAEQQRSNPWTFGPIVDDDNDRGESSYEERLSRIEAALFGCWPHRRLPVFMNMADVWPLNWGTNMHDLMKHHRCFSGFLDPVSHWNNLFADNEAARNYTKRVNELFAWSAART